MTPTLFDHLDLHVRAVRSSDAPALATILAHWVRTSPATLDIDIPDSRFFTDKIQAVEAFDGPFLVLEDSQGALAGYAYGARYRPKRGYNSSVELSIYLAPNWTAKGVGGPLLDALVDQCRKRGFRLAISIATVDPAIGAQQMPSGKLHLRAGFEYVGTIKNVATKFGQFWDTATFTLDLAPEQQRAEAEAVSVSQQ